MIQRSIYDRVAGWQIIAVNNDILLNIRAGLHRGGKQLASTNVGCSEWHLAPRTCDFYLLILSSFNHQALKYSEHHKHDQLN